MGYYISIRECIFSIKNENKIKAMKALKKLAECKELAWVDKNKVIESNVFELIINEFRWDVKTEENGDISSIDFFGEKLGDELTFFNEIAPFVEKDSYIEMIGEDENIWRWFFDGNNCKEIYPTISW